MQLYLKTKYPHIFKDTYWGAFTWEASDHAGDAQVIANRNEFVEKFGIIKEDTRKTAYKKFADEDGCHHEGADHPEAYRTKDDSIVCVISVYTNDIPQDLHDRGFVWSPPLYSSTANTYIAVFPSAKSARKGHATGFKNVVSGKKRSSAILGLEIEDEK